MEYYTTPTTWQECIDCLEAGGKVQWLTGGDWLNYEALQYGQIRARASDPDHPPPGGRGYVPHRLVHKLPPIPPEEMISDLKQLLQELEVHDG